MSLANDAYGWLCAGIPVALERLQGAVIACMDQGLLSLRDAGAQLRRSAESHLDAESESESRVDELK